VNQLKELDRKLIEATQAGLPIIKAPYASGAAEIGTTETAGKLNTGSSTIS